MNSWIYAFLAFLLVASLPFFWMCWKLSQITCRAVRHIKPTSSEPSEQIKAILQPAIAELEGMEFVPVGYHQIERAHVRDEKLDWGMLFYNEQYRVFSGVSISQFIDSDLTDPNIPKVEVAFSSFFADKGNFTTVNSKIDPAISNVIGKPPLEVSFSLQLGNIPIAKLWEAHQNQLQEFCLHRQPIAFSPEEYLETIQRNSICEIYRLVGTKALAWVETDRSYRYSWQIVIRLALFYTPKIWSAIFSQSSGSQPETPPNIELEIEQFQAQLDKPTQKISPKLQRSLLLGTLAMFVAVYSTVFSPQKLLIFVGVLVLHESGHVLAMKWFGYRDVTMLFIPFLGALATAKKEDASLSEKVWISLAGPLPGLILGIGLAIAFTNLENPFVWNDPNTSWLRPLIFTLIGLNLFNLLPVYPLDGGQVADLLLFSSNPYLGVGFKSLGVGLLVLIGLRQPLFLAFAFLIAISIPHSFRVAKLQKQLRKKFRQNPASDRPVLIRRIFESLQQPPYKRFGFVQKSGLAKSILDTQKEKSATWQTRASLSAIYLISLIGGAVGGLYAIFPSPQAWMSMANSLSYIGKDSQAILRERMQAKLQEANRQIQVNPQDAKAYANRGRAYFLLKNNSEALADANQAIKLDPQAVEGYLLRGQIRLTQNDKDAESDFKVVKTLTNQKTIREANLQLNNNSKDVNAYVMRASAFGQLGDSQSALTDFKKALELEPKNPNIFAARAQFYLEAKNYQQAIADANRSMSLDPKSARAYFVRSEAYRKLGDLPKAEADLKKAEELESSYENKDEDPKQP